MSVERGDVYASFPHYKTFAQLELDGPQVMLLSNMVAWIVFQNRELFRDALGRRAEDARRQVETQQE